MLLRRDGATVITQPAHAWLAGRLAREWGATGFAVPEPREEVILAASLHDIGWVDWERRPALNAATGLPLLFNEVAPEQHVRLWAAGVERAAAFGAFPALLVSRHGDVIYEKTAPLWGARAETAAVVHRFLDAQARRQHGLIVALAGLPGMAACVADGHLALLKRFIAALDLLSLHLCWGVDEAVTLADVPAADGATVAVTLAPAGRDGVVLDPWPFRSRHVVVTLEGRRVRPCATQAALDRALVQAAPVPVTLTLAAPA